MGQGIKAKCKQCSNEFPADQFKLHYVYKQMVCPNCFKGKKEKTVKEILSEPRPKGWDKEDEYLEKVSKTKDQQVTYSKIPGTDLVKYKCVSCQFQFKYNPFRKRPATCPYCNGEIPKFKTLSLF